VSDLTPTPPSGTPSEPEPNAGGFLSAPQSVSANDARNRRRYERRFIAVYAALGVVLVGAIIGFVVILAKPAAKPSATWSTWQPSAGTTNQMTNQIAQHVAHEYRLSKRGGQLVAIVPSKPTVTSGTTDIAIKAIAIRKANTSNGIEVLNSTGTEMYNFCGLGQRCSIASGKATSTRGRLVRREALEVALYTFKFVPGVNAIIAFMPPPPNQSSAAPVLFLRKENFKDALDRPLAQTLRLSEPPLPTQSDTSEGTTIDQLTLPSLFSYELQALQTGGAALVLDPAT
jgi:hypothetical protein